MKKKSLNAKKKIHNSILKHLTNKKILKIYKSRKHSSVLNEKYKPGTIIMNKNTLLISTGTGLIEVLELKMEGKKKMNNIEFYNGFKSLNKTNLS